MLKTSIKTITCLFLLMLFSLPAGAQSVQKKVHQKAPPKAQKAPALPKKQNAPLRGKLEKLSCKLGTEDRHARIAVELIGGRVKSLAYYSKWKPRTCSVYIVRDDAFSKWEDTGNVTVVTLKEEKGAFLIDSDKRSVKFLFRDIDRERFCGMNGKITGSLTVTRGSDQCVLEGVMDEPESRDLPQEPPQEASKEPLKEAAKEPAKDVPKEGAKEVTKEAPKEPVKDLATDPARDVPKDPPKEQPAAAAKTP
jgi:hypothetical protein